MYLIKEYEQSYNKEVNDFIISILVDEYGFEKGRTDLEKEDNSLYLENNGKFWIALDKNGNIIGTILIFRYNNEYIEIKKFYVRKDYRGKGISKELYNKAIDFCEKMSFKKIIIGTYTKLERAVQFYMKNGFKEIVLEGKTREGTIYMEKNI